MYEYMYLEKNMQFRLVVTRMELVFVLTAIQIEICPTAMREKRTKFSTIITPNAYFQPFPRIVPATEQVCFRVPRVCTQNLNGPADNAEIALHS
jgi:hypothetical protein